MGDQVERRTRIDYLCRFVANKDEKHFLLGIRWNDAPESTTYVNLSICHFVLLIHEKQLLLTCRDCRCTLLVGTLLQVSIVDSPPFLSEVLEILLEVPRLPTVKARGSPP